MAAGVYHIRSRSPSRLWQVPSLTAAGPKRGGVPVTLECVPGRFPLQVPSLKSDLRRSMCGPETFSAGPAGHENGHLFKKKRKSRCYGRGPLFMVDTSPTKCGSQCRIWQNSWERYPLPERDLSQNNRVLALSRLMHRSCTDR